MTLVLIACLAFALATPSPAHGNQDTTARDAQADGQQDQPGGTGDSHDISIQDDVAQDDVAQGDAAQDEAKQDDTKQDDAEQVAEDAAKIEEAAQQAAAALENFGNLVDAVVDVAQDEEEAFVDEHFEGGITLDVNRELKRNLDLARQQIEEGSFSETARFLGELLTDRDTKDFFLAPEGSERIRRSFRATVHDMIADLPPGGREAYELLFGGEARKLLETAVADHDWEAMHDVVRRYYHTEAGCQALYLLGTHYLDLDRAREALVCLERLQALDAGKTYEPRLSALVTAARYRAGDIDLAIADIESYRESSPETLELLSPAMVAELTSADAIRDWLNAVLGSPSRAVGLLSSDWMTLRGSPSRNGVATATAPLLSSNRQEELGSTFANKAISSYQQAMNDAGLAVIPALNPVVVGDRLLISTGAGLIVRELSTGRVWSHPSSDASTGLANSFWKQTAYGTPATNGRLAFVVEDQAQAATGTVNAEAQMQQVFRRGGFIGGPVWIDQNTGSSGVHLSNSLTAIDLESRGKIRWQIGGQHGGNEPLLAGAYFLGSPLNYGSRLYVMAEFKGSIRLVAVAAETGQLEWMQELAIAEFGIADDHYRRMAGTSPSIADGVIVCPTSCGGVIALDLTTQSLLWAYRYPRRSETFQDPRYGYNNGVTTMPNEQGNRWIDPTAVIADGAVVVTPLESDEVHCLDLRTGALRWKKPRGQDQQNLFVACIDDGKVVMVGRERVIAWNTENGRAVWKQPLELPESAFPSGQGVHTRGQYWLPLSDATLARVDLELGTIVDSQTTSRQIPLGNLVFAQGQFVSMGPRFLEVFPERAALEKEARDALAANPNDATGLTQIGELLQSDGATEEAIDHFQRAYQAEPTSRRKNLLVSALLSGIHQKLPNAAEYDELLKQIPIK